jgi:D-glycero-alpha-D-manno-heptose-7-phosphate kinase
VLLKTVGVVWKQTGRISAINLTEKLIMIISKTPFRMSFFGGGTDFTDFFREYGGAVISTTIDKYCYVNVRHLPRFFDYSTELSYSIIERVRNVDAIKHPAIREAMKMLDMHEIRLTYEADLPARSGLGTSSSFAVGMLNAFHALKGKYANKRKLADEAIYLERILCDESGGIQDQIAASYGGFNRISFNTKGYTVDPIIISPARKEELNANLMLFFTGFSRFSSDIQLDTRAAFKDKKLQLLEMLKLVGEAENILTTKTDLNEFGRLLDHTWKLKRAITTRVSTDFIDALYDKAIHAGATGGKLLGAGGGGFLLFYVEQDKQERVGKAMEDLLYIPFEFENSGSQIIYYSPESFAPVEDRGEIRMAL